MTQSTSLLFFSFTSLWQEKIERHTHHFQNTPLCAPWLTVNGVRKKNNKKLALGMQVLDKIENSEKTLTGGDSALKCGQGGWKCV